MSDRDQKTDEDEEAPTEATRREGPARLPRPTQPPHLARGTLVGRYVVLDVLGAGGMGVVYSGFDPELDRRVAIKLLQAEPGGSANSDQVWLLREAQALARLSHPNVVAVHDVGTLPGDRVFIAMELVTGLTLREWLKPAPRTWREVLPVMRAAGAGLAAAHRERLVHRDFKPENVIVGDDGRVRVMDFGLARIRSDDDVTTARNSDILIEKKSPLTEELTIAGQVVGTPAYMAPELYRGARADARSDQFSFGVALYESLFHVRPYSKAELKALDTQPKLAPDTGVPARIQRVVMRAIALDPAERYPSMDALLADLAIDPRSRWMWFGIAGVTALATAGVTAMMMTVSRAPAEAPCQGIERRLDGVWDPKIKHTVHDAFEATKRAFAPSAYAGLERALDQYATRWTTASVESCVATWVRRDQTEKVRALRQACLDQRLEEFHAVTKLLEQADASLVEKGDAIAWDLVPVTRCANVALLLAPGEPPAEIKTQVDELDKKIAEAKAQLIGAKYLSSLMLSKECIDTATKLGYQPALAQALSIRAGALLATGNVDDGLAVYTAATWTAVRAKRDDIAAYNSLTTAMMVAEGKKRPDEARIWLGFADALTTRVGVDPQLEIKRLAVEGVIADAAGDVAAEVAAQEKAFAASVREYGPDDPILMSVEQVFAGTLMRASAWSKAVAHLEHVLALREGSVGPEHPDVALILSNLGASYRHLHQLDKARPAFERSLAIREKVYGKNSPLLIATLDNFGEYLREAGETNRALAMMERARQLAFILPGPTNVMYHQLLTDYADTYVAAGRLADAKKLFDDAFALEQANHSSILPVTQTSRAELALIEHGWNDAASLADKAITAYEGSGGKTNPVLWRPLTALGKALVGQHKLVEAKAVLERAIAIGEKAQVEAGDLAPARAALSQVGAP